MVRDWAQAMGPPNTHNSAISKCTFVFIQICLKVKIGLWASPAHPPNRMMFSDPAASPASEKQDKGLYFWSKKLSLQNSTECP
jgi:hypothetical protein